MTELPIGINRRTFLGRGVAGLGTLGLASLLDPLLFSAAHADTSPGGAKEKWTGIIHPLHYPQKIKRVIHLCMAGGPSHLETFDYKPKLAAMHGQPMPESFTKGQQIAQLQGQALKCFGPQTTFKKFGKSGLEMADIFPYLGQFADEICIIRSMHTDQINHDPAHTLMNTAGLHH